MESSLHAFRNDHDDDDCLYEQLWKFVIVSSITFCSLLNSTRQHRPISSAVRDKEATVRLCAHIPVVPNVVDTTVRPEEYVIRITWTIRLVPYKIKLQVGESDCVSYFRCETASLSQWNVPELYIYCISFAKGAKYCIFQLFNTIQFFSPNAHGGVAKYNAFVAGGWWRCYHFNNVLHNLFLKYTVGRTLRPGCTMSTKQISQENWNKQIWRFWV